MSHATTRSFTRVLVHHDVEAVSDDGRVVRGPLLDVSVSGLSIATGAPLPNGTCCTLRIQLSSGAHPIEIEARGVVLRADDDGLAFRLTSVDTDSFEHLHNLVLYNASNARQVEEELEAHADQHPPLAPLHDLI